MTSVSQAVHADSTEAASSENSFSVPMLTSEAYSLGIKMEKMLLSIYTILDSKRSPANQEVVQAFIERKKEELKKLDFYFRFALNCELDRFYQQGGTVTELAVNSEQISSTRPLIIRNLNNFYNRIGELQDELRTEKYFDTESAEDLYLFGTKSRECSIDLYRRLAALYPAGEIRKAFLEMAGILEAEYEDPAVC